MLWIHNIIKILDIKGNNYIWPVYRAMFISSANESLQVTTVGTCIDIKNIDYD